MSRKLATLTVALAAAVVLIGALAAANETVNLANAPVERLLWRTAAAAPQQKTKPPPAAVRAPDLEAWIGRLLDNKEILIYGGIASFGILLIAFAIGSTPGGSKSDVRLQIESLKQEKEKAEQLASLKAEFLNQVSHELRTPLAVIIGYVECITDGLYGQLDGKHNEILQIVAKQSDHLKNMIDQILIYSRLEANKQAVRVQDFQLTNLVAEIKDSFDFLCRQKNLEMRWELPRDPSAMRNDPNRVKEVISNLLQNAVKYTDRGSVTVSFSESRSGEAVVVEVRDTGMGISQQHIANIFEPFMQVHKTSTENSRGGIGLGLSIVKRHLEQIKGSIHVESEIGKGSTFRVVFPKNLEYTRSRALRLLGLLLPRSKNRSRAAALATPEFHPVRQKPVNTGHTLS
jgi:signal transduction histidine kinase